MSLIRLAALAALLTAAAPPPPVFRLSSTGFKDGEVLRKKFAGNLATNPNCMGENVSPQLAWHNVPAGTTSIVLFMFDVEGNSGAGVAHWIAYGIPPEKGQFAEGEAARPAIGYLAGKSTKGLNHYLGPCTPPATDWHHYTFMALAIDLPPDALPAGLTREELLPKLDGHVTGSTTIVGRFRHP